MVNKNVIVRSAQAGVFFGELVEKQNHEGFANVKLKNSRRVWYWSGAASLSQLAIDGTSSPDNCKFPEAIENHEVFGVCEIIDMTQKAFESLSNVKIWKS